MTTRSEAPPETPAGAPQTWHWLWLLAAGCLVVRLSNACHYPLRSQHDPTVHLGYLRELAHLQFPQTYNAPWYYALLCFLGAPAIALCKALHLSETVLATAAVGLGNTLLFFLYFAGMLRLARGLRFSSPDSLLVAVLAASFPVVHRTFDMVRPENLLLTLLPWSLWLALCWRDGPAGAARPTRSAAFWGASLAVAVAASQKLGGLALAVGVGALAVARDEGSPGPRLRRLAPAMLAVCCLYGLLAGIHVLLSGANPLVHDPDPAPTRPPPSGFFLRVDPASLWERPVRDSQRDSMPGILLADACGDYWQYGYDAGHPKPPEEVSIRRGRFGLVITLAFLLLAVPAAALLAREGFAGEAAVRARGLQRLCALLPAPLGLLYLAMAALRFYRSADGDIVKWEYISWCFPCAALLLGDLAGRVPGAAGPVLRAALATLAAAGLVQSVVL